MCLTECPCVLGCIPSAFRAPRHCSCVQATLQSLKEQGGLPLVALWRHSRSSLTSCLNAAASAQEVAAVTSDSVLNSLEYLRVCRFAHVTEVHSECT